MGDAAGNGTEAARLAGYKGSADTLGVQAHTLLRRPKIQAALKTRREALASQSIASVTERREILSAIMRTAKAPLDRTRAVDVANKMDGVYVEKHEHKVEIPGAIAFLIAKAPNADVRS